MKELLALNCDRGRGIHGYKRDDVAKKEVEWKGELDVKDPRANREDYQRFIAKGSLEGESHRGYFYLQPSEDIPADDPFVGESSRRRPSSPTSRSASGPTLSASPM